MCRPVFQGVLHHFDKFILKEDFTVPSTADINSADTLDINFAQIILALKIKVKYKADFADNLI